MPRPRPIVLALAPTPRHPPPPPQALLRDYVPFFADLPAASLRELAPLFTTELYERGQRVMEQGDDGEHVYVLVQGEVSVTSRTASGSLDLVRISDASEYTYFGELALYEKRPRSATVTAIERTLLLVLHEASFEIFTSLVPDFVNRVKMLKALDAARHAAHGASSAAAQTTATAAVGSYGEYIVHTYPAADADDDDDAADADAGAHGPCPTPLPRELQPPGFEGGGYADDGYAERERRRESAAAALSAGQMELDAWCSSLRELDVMPCAPGSAAPRAIATPGHPSAAVMRSLGGLSVRMPGVKLINALPADYRPATVALAGVGFAGLTALAPPPPRSDASTPAGPA